MGIGGLLQLLQPVTTEVCMKAYAGERVAVDSYCWLHRGVYGCAYELAIGKDTDMYVNYCMKRLQMLRFFNVEPVVVLDGAPLPSKRGTEVERKQSRRANHELGLALLRAGKRSRAVEKFQKSIDITPEIAHKLVLACREQGFECIVAPFEADAQLAHLYHTGYVKAVITEDSDLLVYGCKRVVFKLDEFGVGQEIRLDRVFQGAKLVDSNVNFMSWSVAQFRWMCIISGCDYVNSLQGLGLKTAYKLVKMAPSLQHVLKQLRRKGHALDGDYEAQVIRAEQTFLHQVVWDPVHQTQRHLTDPPAALADKLAFAGT
eukprot:m.225641 g.225641  ORF g.225641 m.225641 type:complete len:316 (-) comp15161_c0_seq16:1808-2755(-)